MKNIFYIRETTDFNLACLFITLGFSLHGREQVVSKELETSKKNTCYIWSFENNSPAGIEMNEALAQWHAGIPKGGKLTRIQAVRLALHNYRVAHVADGAPLSYIPLSENAVKLSNIATQGTPIPYEEDVDDLPEDAAAVPPLHAAVLCACGYTPGAATPTAHGLQHLFLLDPRTGEYLTEAGLDALTDTMGDPGNWEAPALAYAYLRNRQTLLQYGDTIPTKTTRRLTTGGREVIIPEGTSNEQKLKLLNLLK